MNRNRNAVSTLALSAAVAALLLAVPVAPASGQDVEPETEADGRWLPWTGCWEAIGQGADESLLCVRPAEGGVELVTVLDGGVVSVESLIADGEPRDFELEGCTGTKVAEFSPDGERIYLDGEVVCEGVRQRTSGVIAMVSPYEWVDIRGTGGEAGAWSRTYQMASEERAAAGFPDMNADREMAVRTLRWRASEPSDLDDLMEVHSRVDADVTRAWVSEQNDPFEIDSNALVRLADAGVSEDVIDIVVAVSFPDRFALAEPRPSSSRYASGPGYGGYVDHEFYRMGYLYNPYSLGFGYSRYGAPYRRCDVIVQAVGPVSRGGGTSSNGVRLIPGQGYTRVRDGSRTTTSTGAATRSGESSTSGGRSTGRRAKPRTGGGGG